MLVNITRIGRVLWDGQVTLAKGSRASEGPDVWLLEVQELRRRPYRTLVVLHQYSGRRRWGDVEYWAKELAAEHAWGLHFTSADSGTADSDGQAALGTVPCGSNTLAVAADHDSAGKTHVLVYAENGGSASTTPAAVALVDDTTSGMDAPTVAVAALTFSL